MENGALSLDEFSCLMDEVGIDPSAPLCVAVSGGADSMAMTILASKWCNKGHFVTFDHDLREGSRKEALQVTAWLSELDLKHVILTWDGEKPTSDIQAQARGARYNALENYCIKNEIPNLLLGHHRDDQAETFFIRLLRGSGIKGLSAMEKISKPNTTHSGPKLVRPLLDIPKERLIKTLEEIGQPWIEDPSNENESFLRVKVRKLLETTNIEGLERDRLADTAKRMQRANDFLEREVGSFIHQNCKVKDENSCTINLNSFSILHEEIALRALSFILMRFGKVNYPPRLKKIERLYENCLRSDYKGSTLSRCRVWTEEGNIFIRKEFK